MAGTWHGGAQLPEVVHAVQRGAVPENLRGGAEHRAFIRRLSAVEPDEIIQASRVEYSAALRFARTIRDKYNAQGGGPELPYRFKR